MVPGKRGLPGLLAALLYHLLQIRHVNGLLYWE